MLRSMTGFGHDEIIKNGVKITVEIRTVNHRYCDIYLRMPKQFNVFEDRVRSVIAGEIIRGKVDVSITLDSQKAEINDIILDEGLAASYMTALNQIANLFSIKNDISTSSLSRYPDVLRVERKEMDEELGGLLEETVRAGLDSLMLMRECEGQRLGESLFANLLDVEKYVSLIALQSPSVVLDYKERLESRIADLVETQKLDPARLATEIAIFSDKCSVEEELVRLGSHVNQMKEMLSNGSPIGKKIDFLVQEMNREVNTIGSKSNNLAITQNVIELKSEIEIMREQIQNIE